MVTMLACFVLFAREAVGAGQSTRHSLRPLSSRVPSMQPSDANALRERGLISSRFFDIQIESLKQRVHPLRHARACRGHPRLALGNASRTWMTGTRPGHDGAERIAADFGSSKERRSIHLVMPALVAVSTPCFRQRIQNLIAATTPGHEEAERIANFGTGPVYSAALALAFGRYSAAG